jgi:carboxyl-terminal processing protease
VTSLLVDLRGNGGGEVQSFVRLAGDFLEDGALVVTMTDGDGDEVECCARQSPDYAVPVALLVDAGTASAAELFAGCLQAHGRAVVVGERTFGKGEAQSIVTGSDGEPVYTSVVTLTLPGGRRVQGRGVEPDLPAPRGDREAWRVTAERVPPALADAIFEVHGAERTRP